MRGLTVAETILAAALLLVTFMAFLNLLPASVVAEKRSQQRTQADAVARAVVEEALAASFSSLAVGTTPTTDVPVNETTFHVTRTVTQLSTYLKQLDVLVTWDEPGATALGNATRRFSMRSMVSRVNR